MPKYVSLTLMCYREIEYYKVAEKYFDAITEMQICVRDNIYCKFLRT